MIEFVGADTKLHPDSPVRIGECTPTNPSGKSPASIPQLMSPGDTTRMTDQSMELQLWLELPGAITLGLIPIVTGGVGAIVAAVTGPNAIKTAKVVAALVTPIVIAYSYSNKSSKEKADKEARAKEYREKLEQVTEKQEIDDRKAGRPTMQA